MFADKEIGSVHDWFILTELSNEILVQLTVKYKLKSVLEGKKKNPNQDLINEYTQLSAKYNNLSNDPIIFNSKENMRNAINEYSQILDAIS